MVIETGGIVIVPEAKFVLVLMDNFGPDSIDLAGLGLDRHPDQNGELAFPSEHFVSDLD